MDSPCRSVTTAGRALDAALSRPATAPPGTTVADARAFFADDHVHALLLVDGERLLAVVERADLVDAGPGPVRPLGRLAGRTVAPDADLALVHGRLLAEGGRRLAVVDEDGTLLGLLCLKRSGRGFCSDADVAARAAERAASEPALVGLAS